MSLNILKDNALDVDISLIKAVRVVDGTLTKKLSEIVPVDLSAIVKLSLVDSIVNHGLKGVVTINNKSKILDKLKITSGTVSDIYIKIVIKSKDLENTSALNKIECLCLVKNTTSASANIEDSIVEFEFEEAVIAEMRYTSWSSLMLNSKISKDSTIDIIELVDTFYEYTLLKESGIKRITLPASKSSSNDPSLSESFGRNDPLLSAPFGFDRDEEIESEMTEVFYTYSEPPSLKVPYSGNHDITNSDEDAKVFDIFKKLLKKTSIDHGGSDSYQFPIFRFVNTPEGRRMRFAPLITERHREFIRAVEGNVRGAFGMNYEDVYLEKFNIGPLSQAKGLIDKNTSWHNTIESHDIVPPDTDTLRESRWCNTVIVGAGAPKNFYDIGVSNIKFVMYAEALRIFANDILNISTCGLNLPLLPADRLPQNIIYKKGDFPDAAKTTRNQALYKQISSFLLVNEQLHFSVKGRLYREPGYFIVVDSGEVVEKTNPQQAIDNMKQVWFVTHVTHVIDNGEYTTDLICNRYFGDNTLEMIEEYVRQADIEFNQSINERQNLVNTKLINYSK